MAKRSTPDFCELCGRSGPVMEMDLLVNPGLAMEYPVICGNDCYMLPMMTMPLYAKILNLMEQYEEEQRTETDLGSERDSEN